MATIPVGYSDGFDRKLSNKGKVCIRGRLSPVSNRISMNFTTVELPLDLKVSPNAIAELIGSRVSALDLAENLDTISYEVLARINPPVSRILVK